MKTILLLIINIIIFVLESTCMFILMLWFGDLPKVSIYHYSKEYYRGTTKSVFKDRYAQSKYDKVLDKNTVRNIVSKVLNESIHNPEFVPILDKKRNIIGQQSFESYILDLLKKELDKN